MRKDLPNETSKSKPVAAHEADERARKPLSESEREKRERMVDEALDESFPASDPPAFNKTTAGSH